MKMQEKKNRQKTDEGTDEEGETEGEAGKKYLRLNNGVEPTSFIRPSGLMLYLGIR